MAKQIARLLKTDIMADMDLKALAQILQKQGRGNDTVLAHITKKEAERLKKQGGSGTINPNTGLPEFDDTGAIDTSSYTPIDTSGGGITTAAGQGTPTSDYQYQPQATPSAPIDITQPTPSAGGEASGGISPPIQFGQPSNQPGINANTPISFGAGVQLPGAGTPSPTFQDVATKDINAAIGGGTTQDNTLLNKLLSPENIGKYGLAGIQGLIGAYQTNKAQKQGQQAKTEQMKIAQPYQQQGKQLIDQAQRGELSTASQQQLEAAQAQAAQGIEARGGVGAAQYQAQIEGLRQQLLNQQYQLGLQISNIGDSIATGAIKTGMQADQYVNQLTSNYFTNIARTAMGSAPQVAQSTIPSNYGVSA